jgi:hypothetical protein
MVLARGAANTADQPLGRHPRGWRRAGSGWWKDFEPFPQQQDQR